ncbi:transposase [Ollibium composti]|uniref:transposase n=1 Tax=Ollibium composti TaxID=2675109 RepID=UPI001454C439
MFKRGVGEVRGLDWVVYAKPPFAGPEQLAHLGRYTHRVAIAKFPSGQYRRRRDLLPLEKLRRGGRAKFMELDVHEFISRRLPRLSASPTSRSNIDTGITKRSAMYAPPPFARSDILALACCRFFGHGVKLT